MVHHLAFKSVHLLNRLQQFFAQWTLRFWLPWRKNRPWGIKIWHVTGCGLLDKFVTDVVLAVNQGLLGVDLYPEVLVSGYLVEPHLLPRYVLESLGPELPLFLKQALTNLLDLLFDMMWPFGLLVLVVWRIWNVILVV